jgi:hypothetical protein
MRKLRQIGLLVGISTALGASASPALADPPAGERATISVVCTASGFTVDAHAFHGQRTEVTAFYNATGIVCRLFDTASGALLYDPSA